MIDDIAAVTPNRAALEAAGASLSYGALTERANRLANYLQALGIGHDDVVGICLERSFDQIIAQLAILKAGAAFLPLDPAWPAERLARVLDDADARVVIGRGGALDRLAGAARTAVALDIHHAAIAASPASDPAVAPSGDALAYVIYTSGSTGAPKGVEITHDNLLNLIAWHQGCFAIARTDRAGHVAGLGFDAAVWEVWPHLCAGATVVLAD
ncbi:MAG: AMP-binding protein, partial [Alphaproteobacteria bacterium]|nr:AMP-binding protein [Alphaproteobacteria bacterium]